MKKKQKNQQKCFVISYVDDDEPYCVFDDEKDAKKLCGDNAEKSGFTFKAVPFNPKLKSTQRWEVEEDE